jgi:lysophospholipase
LDNNKLPVDPTFHPVPPPSASDQQPNNEDISAWWSDHVEYYQFNRQGINIMCASFEHKAEEPKANVVVVTGWNQTFLHYADIIRRLFDSGFNVHTYDHQSQGFSGRWLEESPQSTWVHSFGDYVDDFVYFVVTFITRGGFGSAPVYVLAHSMGGLIVSIAMERLPALIDRAVLSAPMLRNKCALKCFDYNYPLPQQLVYYITMFCCEMGLGRMNGLGFFIEDPKERIKTYVRSSDYEQMNIQQQIKETYPETIACCVTNQWILESIVAQKKFARVWDWVRTETLVIAAEHDRFVYTRAMRMFVKEVPYCKLLFAPNAYHELLHENVQTRGAVETVIADFFLQVKILYARSNESKFSS